MILKSIVVLVMLLCSLLQADNIKHYRADSHAPIGVMADHGHKKSELMVSYRHMTMAMDTLYQGDSTIASSEVTGYTMIPQDMTMSMHMVGAMYGLTKTLTVMSMIGHVTKEMTAASTMMTSSMESNGITDLKLSGIYTLKDNLNKLWVTNIGLSLPLGSIDEANGGSTRIGYPMQLGSGTYDVMTGSTYSVYKSTVSFGAKAAAVIRTGKNDHGYRLGNSLSLTAWVAKLINPAISVSARLTRAAVGDIKGADAALNTSMTPANSTNANYTTYMLATGANIQLPAKFAGFRVAVEYTVPIYYTVGNVQLTTDSTVLLGLQHLF